MRKKIPNLLSILRILAGAIVLAIYSSNDTQLYIAAICVLIVGLLTDFADGYFARRFKATSELGYILDGLGDRSMYVALILTLVANHSVSLLIAWLLIFRDVLIYALRLLMPRWHSSNQDLRYLSRLHAGSIRIWFLTFLVADGTRLLLHQDVNEIAGFQILQAVCVGTSIAAAYYGLMLQAKSIIIATSKIDEAEG